MAKNQNPDADDFGIEFDVSTLDDKGKQLYENLNKQFRDAWLKKSNEAATGRQGIDRELGDAKKRMQELEQQAQQLQQENQQFKEWWQREGQFLYDNPTQAAKAEGFQTPGEANQEFAALRRDFVVAQQKYDQVIQKLDSRVGDFERALRLQHDLFDLRFKHPKADMMKVLDTAKEKGLTNLDMAYEMAYGEEERESMLKEKEEELQKNFDTRLEEELKKREAESKIVETTPTSRRYAPPETAKSYSEAGQNLLKSIRGSGGTLTD